ncbi:MAG: integrase core domain-containing protein [Acidobacteriaceae bacterium]
MREWAYARLYQSSADRLQHLAPWIYQYNWRRPHANLNQRPPRSRRPSTR